MEQVYLIRDYKGTDCTLGKLKFKDEALDTLELPWKNNQQLVSCIPDGKYTVKKTYSPKFRKDMWEVLKVPDRSGIRIHGANYVSELRGCIAPGMRRYDINKDGTIDMLDTKKAMSILTSELPDEFELIISWKV